MADALSSLVDKSQEAVSQSAQGGEGEGGEEVEPLPLSDYEDMLQDWLASVHVRTPPAPQRLQQLTFASQPAQDIQLTLRKAIRFLVVAQHPPVLTASHSLVAGGGSNVAKAGRAAMPSHLEKTQAQGSQQGADGGKEANGEGSSDDDPLSLSALRVQHQAWKDFLSTLEGLKAQQDSRTQDGGGDGGGRSKWPNALLDELIPPQIQR